MAEHHDNSDALMPFDGTFDATEQVSFGLPFSQDEIDDLLYGSDRPVEERVDRLKEMRAELAVREQGDFGEEDPKAMIAEIDRALDELQGDASYADENGAFDAAVDLDPADHLDALSPDDVESRAALTGQEDDADENFAAELEDDEQAANLGLN